MQCIMTTSHIKHYVRFPFFCKPNSRTFQVLSTTTFTIFKDHQSNSKLHRYSEVGTSIVLNMHMNFTRNKQASNTSIATYINRTVALWYTDKQAFAINSNV